MIFKSSYPNIDIPDVGVYQFVTSNPNKISDNKAIFIDGITEKKVTFAIFSHNVVDYPIAAFGAIAAGGIVTSSSPLSREYELTFNLIDSGASMIFVHPNYLDVVVKAAEDAKIPKSKIFLLGEEVGGFQSYCSLIGDHEIEPISYTSEEVRTTIAFLGSSSGTTGKPKGIELTHKNVVAAVMHLAAAEYTVGNIFMGMMPFYYMYGMVIIVISAVFLGDSTIVIPRFELGLFCSCIQKYKISYAHASLPIVLELIKNPIAKNYDISNLKMVFSTGAPLSILTSKKFYDIHKIPIKQGYGLTETSLLAINKSDNIVAGSVGVLIPNIEAKVVSEEGLELGYNERGELWVRGPTLSKGYLNNEEATKASFDKDGFFHTGDLVFVDDNSN
ncbi:acetyl-CoA synthetase-like protein [Gigaspora margarita]|uniref:Acetyl-CoA synthetase-like protein n=1 Tax=Gigaspora margarita TaxID=4874 RepID=A0A8H4EUT3_GIGMA|nr:acetyl-CoA synthetase-like protein [Gigaspora margarita]